MTTTRTATNKSAVSVGEVGPANASSAPSNKILDEVITLTRRLRMPYLRAAALDVVPTARAQRWDPAELLRVLLGEEITGRDRRRSSKREQFLEQMDAAIPWVCWVKVVEPHYYRDAKGKRGRKAKPVETMLRMYLLQAWFSLSDEGPGPPSSADEHTGMVR